MRRLLPVLAVAAVLGMGAAGVLAGRSLLDGGGPTYRGSAPPAELHLPPFSLHDYRGPTVRSGDLRGKAVLVTFLESRCEEACPVIATQVTRGLVLLDPEQRGEVEAIAISTNPEEDSPASVRTFLRAQHAEGTFRYLVGTERELRPVWKAFLVLSSLDSGQEDVHSAPVRIYDRRGIWVSTLHPGADLTPANLRHDVLEALS
jgi:protein SCO1/2